jgi:6-phosphofructokinase
MSKNTKKILAVVLLLVVLAAAVLAYQHFKPQASQGAKTVTVEVVHKDESKKEFVLHTDAENLHDALDEQKLIEGEEERKDASGNVLKKDIGEFLKRHISEHFKEKDIPCTIKYFDPSYMIRSVPAHGTDAIRCYMLARNAVHAAMAGRTNCVVGNIGEWHTLVPIKLATIERQQVQLSSDLWRSVVDATGQEFWFSPDAKAADLP